MITNLKELFVFTNLEMYIEQYGEYAYLLSKQIQCLWKQYSLDVGDKISFL